MLTTSERCALVERNTAELLTHDELVKLLDTGEELRHYIGFEISGKVHLGSGIVAMAKVADFARAGFNCTIFLADWHTWINDKLGGDLDVIRKIAGGYFTEAMRAGLMCLGADMERIKFVLASDLYTQRPDFWATVVEVGKHTSLARMQRSITIMGRGEGDSVDFAKLLYPAMQAADVFTLGVHLAHAGMDQRKAHVIARDVAGKIKINALTDSSGATIKPMAVHHPLILGLGKPPQWPIPEESERDVLSAMKMSKSKPDSAIFVHDSADEISRKISKAFCPPGEVRFNPILDWVEKLVFALGDGEFVVERSPANGGDVTFGSFETLQTTFAEGKLHPMDLKSALAGWLTTLLEPARSHFAKPEIAATLAEVDRALAGGVVPFVVEL
jgi:tyrosyl-tRNA synthetase